MDDVETLKLKLRAAEMERDMTIRQCDRYCDGLISVLHRIELWRIGDRSQPDGVLDAIEEHIERVLQG